MAPQDPYKRLGVRRDATAEEIKAAYRRVARECHPDVTGGDTEKEERFREATYAYELLSDPGQRMLYDTLYGDGYPIRSDGKAGGKDAGKPGGKDGKAGGKDGKAGGKGGHGKADADTHKAGAGRSPGGHGGAGRHSGIPGTGGTHRAAGIYGPGGGGATAGAGGGGATAGAGSPGGAARGNDRTPDSPDSGRGTGGAQGVGGPRMRGQVTITQAEALLGVEKTITLDLPDGSEREITVRVPPGLTEGQCLRLPLAPLPGRTAVGELQLDIHIEPDRRLRVTGLDVEIDLPVPFTVALLGGTIEVPSLTPGAPATQVRIPAGTSSGRRLRLAGQGAAHSDGRRGDLFGVVMVTVPATLDIEARALAEALARRLG